MKLVRTLASCHNIVEGKTVSKHIKKLFLQQPQKLSFVVPTSIISVPAPLRSPAPRPAIVFALFRGLGFLGASSCSAPSVSAAASSSCSLFSSFLNFLRLTSDSPAPSVSGCTASSLFLFLNRLGLPSEGVGSKNKAKHEQPL